jgi:RNA polymerase sigma-70 factor (ECF subfamily)
MMGTKDEEKDLVRQAQEGSLWAFERLVHKYDKKVLSLAFQLVGNKQDAEDVYQDVFMKVYHKINRFRFESDFYTWLYRIVVNCAISYRKKRNRERHRSIEEAAEKESGWQWTPTDPKAGPDDLTAGIEIREQIHSNLETLPLMQRVVFTLRFLQDFKIKDIAQIIGCSEGTVKNYLFRSTQRMRKHLLPYMES